LVCKPSVYTAKEDFTLDKAKMCNATVHACSELSSRTFAQVDPNGDIYAKACDMIRDVLKAFQVQFGEEITS
jgi:hypothetical protein